MKIRIIKKNLFLIAAILLFFSAVHSEENKILVDEHEFNFYSGIFDFSDKGKNSTLFGIQHNNGDLYRDSFLGTLSPVTGAMITADSATYFYTGIQGEYKIGKMNLTPSFTPGLYNEGDGKDLGHVVEFKSEVQLSFDLMKDSQLGFSYNHISNASLGTNNPGANSYMFNYFKKF
jgi:lipid A 3-O-deacylase